MKIALCVYGQPRTFEFCFPSVKKHILDVYHPDVFIASDSQGDKIKELYRPVTMEIHSPNEEWQFIGDRRYRYGVLVPCPGWLPQFPISPEQSLSFMFKGWRCREILKAYELEHGVYDIVIATRFDVKFLRIPPITIPEKNCLYIPHTDANLGPIDEQGLHWNLGYAAHIYWGSSAIISLVLDAYNWSDGYFQEIQVWCGEMMMKQLCDKHNIRVQYMDIPCMIIRGDNTHPRSCSPRNGSQGGELLSATHFPEYWSGPNVTPTAPYYIMTKTDRHSRKERRFDRRLKRTK